MPDIFLSYNREDQPIAKRIREGLVAEGLDVWLDMALRAGGGASTRPVSELAENPFKLRGVSGNAREWVQDCYVNSFADAPADAAAVERPRCPGRVVRGGSYRDRPANLRIANRGRNPETLRDRTIGFRVALPL